MPARIALPRLLREGLRWWIGELAALLPPRVHAALSRRRRRIILPASRVLVRQATFPQAAEENLREVIAFEMDRVLPFQSEEVYFDFLLRAREPDQNRVVVEIAAARRPVVEEAVAAAGGVARVGVEGLDPRLDLCPPQARRRLLGRADALMVGLGSLFLVLAAGAPFYHVTVRLAALEAEMTRLRSDAAEAERIRASIDSSLAAERLIVEKRAAQPTTLSALEEVTRLLPDDAWLQQFHMTIEGVELQGTAGASSQLLRSLEESPVFAAAMFRAPVTRDSKLDRERFSLGAKWQ